MITAIRLDVAATPLADRGAQKICQIMEEAGRPVLCVGGAVRSIILDRPFEDVDFATPANSLEVASVMAKTGLHVDTTGADHGSIAVEIGGKRFVITSFRRDIRTDGRRAQIAPTKSLLADARRRDLTVNALYADRHGRLIDPLGALSDVRQHRIRFIGNPALRLCEDRLRMLRFFRIAAQLESTDLDNDALAEIRRGCDGVRLLSAERITCEMMKLLAAPNPAETLKIMHAVGLLQRILPETKPDCLVRLERLERRAGTSASAIRRLAALAGSRDVGMLKLERNSAQRVAIIRQLSEEEFPVDVLASRHGAETALDAALIGAAIRGTGIDRDVAALANQGADRQFPLRAEDLMPHFSGPSLGAELRRLRLIWENSGMTSSRAKLLADSRLGGSDCEPTSR